MSTDDRKQSERADATGTPEAPPLHNRRAFLTDVGKKAAYITPVLLSLSATPAAASAFAASCRPIGQPCVDNASCCTSNCDLGGTNLCVP